MFLNNLHLVLFLCYNKISNCSLHYFRVSHLLNFGHAVILLVDFIKFFFLKKKVIKKSRSY